MECLMRYSRPPFLPSNRHRPRQAQVLISTIESPSAPIPHLSPLSPIPELVVSSPHPHSRHSPLHSQSHPLLPQVQWSRRSQTVSFASATRWLNACAAKEIEAENGHSNELCVVASENSGPSEVNCERSVIPENGDDGTCTEADAELNRLGVDGWGGGRGGRGDDPSASIPSRSSEPRSSSPKTPVSVFINTSSQQIAWWSSFGATASTLSPTPSNSLSLLDLPPLSLLPLPLHQRESAPRAPQGPTFLCIHNSTFVHSIFPDSNHTKPLLLKKLPKQSRHLSHNNRTPIIPQRRVLRHLSSNLGFRPFLPFRPAFRVRVFEVSIVLFPNLNSSISTPITTPFPFRLPRAAFLDDFQHETVQIKKRFRKEGKKQTRPQYAKFFL
ncbi:hypothetical protein BLNAU_22816 [Blattamonas nauphoetae]|uniref:Uncharacterized protein n=1 Tax=Blattamonas nauphoetae TaxID=2049346 RepID=A0ABQ9WS19_9EUKA|nr:hypothetical protein BLNAU_22816 [Blattamonas nauphoetae]